MSVGKFKSNDNKKAANEKYWNTGVKYCTSMQNMKTSNMQQFIEWEEPKESAKTTKKTRKWCNYK